MKKIITFLISILSSFSVQSMYNSMAIDIVTLIEKQKSGLLNYAEDFYKAKFELLKKHTSDLFNLKKQNINMWFRTNIMSSDQLLSDLNEMLQLHKKHMLDWKKLCDNYRKKAEQLYDQYIQQINKLETNFERQIQQQMTEEFTKFGQVQTIVEPSEVD